HIDLDSREIGKNWPVEIGLLANPRLAMADIVARLKSTVTQEQRGAARDKAKAVETMSVQMMQVLESAARSRWDATPISAGRILKLNMLEYLGEGAAGRQFVEMDLTQPAVDFRSLAAGFGVKGVRVDQADDIGDAIREAQNANEPRLVDVAIEGDVRSRWL